MRVEGADPDVSFVVDVGPTVVVREAAPEPDDVVVAGDAVALVDALSIRAPLPPTISESDRWMMDGLATAFDTAV